MARRAVLAGASGLVGRHLLALLAADPRWTEVHLLMRRPLPASVRPTGAGQEKLREHVVDFDALVRYPDFPSVDDVFLCLGTTIKAAGSRPAFRKVDFDYTVAVARLARRGGAERLALVSSMGANPASRIFYNRVKGETEAALAELGYPSATVVRPSLLAGQRTDRRRGERSALLLLRPLRRILPKRWRPVPALAVAHAMFDAVARGTPGLRVIESDRIQQFGT
jgi:uncharacterized protein YbjT (DUF2867 family)